MQSTEVVFGCLADSVMASSHHLCSWIAWLLQMSITIVSYCRWRRRANGCAAAAREASDEVVGQEAHDPPSSHRQVPREQSSVSFLIPAEWPPHSNTRVTP